MIGKREMQKITITEKEAIKLLNESYIVDYEGDTDRHRINLEKFLISTLEEIQQYREIGTVEQVGNQKYNLGIAYKIISDYQNVGTVEECRESVEKQKPKKARFYSWSLYCPDCGQLVGNRRFKWENNFCRNCGRAIDWSEEE